MTKDELKAKTPAEAAEILREKIAVLKQPK